MIPNRAPAIPSRIPQRRPGGSALLWYADLSLDPRSRVVRRGERTAQLSYTEARLLALLIRNAGTAVPRAQIERAIWGDEPVTRSATDSAVQRLREKLHAPGEEPLLRTAHGIGYLLRVAPGSDGGAR